MLLRVKSKRVNIDTNLFRDTSVVLVRLNECEIPGISGGESVLTIELKFGINNGVGSAIVGVIRPSVGTSIGIWLNNPDKFLARVVKSKFALDSSA
jgi:hypothetical protein